MLPGQIAHLVEIHPAGVAVHAVLQRREPAPGQGGRSAVGEVAAHGQRHAHDGVTGPGEGTLHTPVATGQAYEGVTELSTRRD